MDCRETLISRGDPTAACFFQVLKERPGAGWRNVLQTKSLDPAMRAAGDEQQELLQRITVALLRIAGEVPLNNEVLQ
jgi:hypothetical protein